MPVNCKQEVSLEQNVGLFHLKANRSQFKGRVGH